MFILEVTVPLINKINILVWIMERGQIKGQIGGQIGGQNKTYLAGEDPITKVPSSTRWTWSIASSSLLWRLWISKDSCLDLSWTSKDSCLDLSWTSKDSCLDLWRLWTPSEDSCLDLSWTRLSAFGLWSLIPESDSWSVVKDLSETPAGLVLPFPFK